MTRAQILAAAASALIAAGLLVALVIPDWLWHPLGVCSGNACGYQFWSGVAGSFLIGGGLWTGGLSMYWRHTCHAPGCLRIGKHPTADGMHHLCARHHPDLPDGRRSLEEIHAAHHAARHGGSHGGR